LEGGDKQNWGPVKKQNKMRKRRKRQREETAGSQAKVVEKGWGTVRMSKKNGKDPKNNRAMGKLLQKGAEAGKNEKTEEAPTKPKEPGEVKKKKKKPQVNRVNEEKWDKTTSLFHPQLFQHLKVEVCKQEVARRTGKKQARLRPYWSVLGRTSIGVKKTNEKK